MRNRHVDKNSLCNDICTKIRTIMIGALASIEKSEFGRLWGQQKLDEKGYIIEELTPEEEQWLAEWDKIREEILEKGNDQIYLARQELRQYSVKKFDNFYYKDRRIKDNGKKDKSDS